MSNVQIAVLPGRMSSRTQTRPVGRASAEHPAVRLLAFGGLGLYGALRWETLLPGGSAARLLGLVALTSVLAAVGPVVAERSRPLAGVGAVLAAAGALAIAGIPLAWIAHLRLAVTARAVGQGLGTLPDINVPYLGVDEWVRLTILLGAAVLLLDAALVLTFVPRQRGYLRQAGAALPLVALAVIPATLLRPALPYLEGVLLFGLLAAFVWSDRLERHRLAGVAVPCALAAAAALVLGPSLDHRRPWINYRALASGLAPGRVETFDWTQRYGPLRWPRTNRAVLEVQAPRRDYWKAENLDVFDGHGWTPGPAPAGAWQEQISSSAQRRWTQTLQVTLRSMSTSKVIAAGEAEQPADVPGGAERNLSPGTWQSAGRLGPGASYRVTVYAPHPSPAQLSSAGTAYPMGLQAGYLSLDLPEPQGSYNSLAQRPGTLQFLTYTPGAGYLVRALFPPFGAGGAAAASPPVQTAVEASPYGGAFELARRLESGATTPYAYVERVRHFLSHGYRYDEKPPSSAYPLASFLLVDKRGYCQHFAGAMALLLRLGGVPARVAVGFTPGSYDSALHRWIVTDNDAHAWVEAWFPHYGWVRFDPTPAAAPALGGHASAILSRAGLQPALPRVGLRHRHLPSSVPARSSAGRRTGGGASAPLIPVLAPLVGLALLIALALLSWAARAGDPVAELARAFDRTGRPLATEATLAGVERRLGDFPEAAAYVRALRLARFASSAEAASLRQRRALRRALADGLGLAGRLRALWALPPRWDLRVGPGRRRYFRRNPAAA